MHTGPAFRIRTIELIEGCAASAGCMAGLFLRPDPSDQVPTYLLSLALGFGCLCLAIVGLERRPPWGRRQGPRLGRPPAWTMLVYLTIVIGLLALEANLNLFAPDSRSMTADAWLRNRILGYGTIWITMGVISLVSPRPIRAERSGDDPAAPDSVPQVLTRFRWP